MVRHVVLDLDGTLVNSHAQIIAVIDEMLAARGATERVDPVGSRQHMSAGGGHLVSTLLGRRGGDPADDLADFRRRYAAGPTSAESLYPGVRKGLTALAGRGLTLSLCSNKPQTLCEAVLGDVGLADLFAVVIGGQPGLRPKPAPDMLAAVLARLGARADECLYVGDSEVDHATAEALGVPFMFVSYGYAAPDWTPAEARRFETFADVVAAIGSGVHA